MATPEWNNHHDGCYSAAVGGIRLVVYQGASPGEWRMKWGRPKVHPAHRERLAATNARDAQIEALEFIRGWATELVAQAAELRGTMEGDDDTG